MKKKKLLKILLIIIAVPVVLIGSLTVYAVVAKSASPENILFPIKMLGSCVSGKECTQYCYDHMTECADFMAKFNLMSPDELKYMRAYAGMLNDDEYCFNVEHFPDCVDVFFKNSVNKPEQMANWQKLAKSLRAGVKLPNGFTNVSEYEKYCGDPVNKEGCTAFYKQYVWP